LLLFLEKEGYGTTDIIFREAEQRFLLLFLEKEEYGTTAGSMGFLFFRLAFLERAILGRN
jgi:hypothetical protein